MGVPKRVEDRIQGCLKQFQGILAQQKARDVSEADTVTIVKDVLSDLFGYDKYSELTSEHSIRGTYCDLAVKIEGKLSFLIEVKAIGLELKEAHVKQAIDYASNQGCEWVVLTNGICWRLYHVLFKKPIDKVELASFDLTTMNARTDADLEKLYLLTREGFTKSALADYRDKKEATSRFTLAAIILSSEAVIGAIRREVRRVSDILVDEDTIARMLREQVIKREALEGDQADSASRRVRSAVEKKSKAQAEPEPATNDTPANSPASNAS